MRIAGSLVMLVLAGVWLALDAQTLDPVRVPPPTIFAVGDIMQCQALDAADRTGRLMERLLDDTPNSVGITLGDNSNDDGSESSYDCFDRSTWGKLRSRLHPTPGNHDYDVDKELPHYFLYFPRAGAPRLGYRAWDLGTWRIYALNSELQPELREAQLDWLERDLRAHYQTKCLLAYFHRPPYSSGEFASPRGRLIFRPLYRFGVDLVVTGHEHFFAALPPLTSEGVVNRSHGVPVLIAGTGGAVFFDRPAKLRYEDQGETVVTHQLGILRMVLRPGRYDWTFIPVDASAPRPSGGGTCHENPPRVQG
jgi:hypothetical protein